MDLPLELLNMMPEESSSNAEQESEKAVDNPKKPLLRVEKDKRKGKTATLITGYEEQSVEVEELAKRLKQKLAVGGSTRDGEILLQGDVRDKVTELLTILGYKVRLIK